jgi:3-methylcrotonyl-CoA carboxylase alpha subunit
MGIRTVAVYSDADAKALHVREADEAHPHRPVPGSGELSCGEKIMRPPAKPGRRRCIRGMGSSARNADFAQAVIDAGLVWVGPKPSSIRAMGLKDAAKKLMDEAGVPTRRLSRRGQAPGAAAGEADAIGYPVLIKAVAGGGGKGMRRVNASEEFQDMLLSCKREAAASFGDDRVLIEKYILRPRHIEVQVFGDSHGNVVHLFERDCSLQRRHQKVIEEAPAPGMDEATRAAVCGAAVKAAQAVDYVGAGHDRVHRRCVGRAAPDRIWFMEMNTRLQVEHPVTEEITGQDLVEWQLRVASGEKLPLRQDELKINGWAMEARLYAEDPAHEFLPSTGRLEHFELGRQIRIDTGVEEGDRISPYYDPMIAKLIARGGTRSEAIDRLIDTLDGIEVWPVKTNAAFLARAAGEPDFRAGEVDTAFIPSKIDTLVPDPSPPHPVWSLAANAMLASDFGREAHPADPWRALQGFRVNGEADLSIALRHGGETRTVAVEAGDELEGVATAHGDTMLVFSAGQAFAFTLPGTGGGAAGGAASDGTLLSPMPGRVIALEVRQGDRVTKGQKLLTLEAMKMEHSLAAPFDGVVAELNAAEGAQVTEGTLLVRVEKGE